MSLDAGNPVLAGWGSGNSAHISVIRETTTSAGTFSVMDPQYGVYTSGTYRLTLGNFKYTNSDTGVSLSLIEIGYKF